MSKLRRGSKPSSRPSWRPCTYKPDSYPLRPRIMMRFFSNSRHDSISFPPTTSQLFFNMPCKVTRPGCVPWLAQEGSPTTITSYRLAPASPLPWRYRSWISSTSLLVSVYSNNAVFSRTPVYGWMDGWADGIYGWMHDWRADGYGEETDKRMVGQMNGWSGRWMNGWTDRWTDGPMDGEILTFFGACLKNLCLKVGRRSDWNERKFNAQLWTITPSCLKPQPIDKELRFRL